jgi:hypothetical protein
VHPNCAPNPGPVAGREGARPSQFACSRGHEDGKAAALLGAATGNVLFWFGRKNADFAAKMSIESLSFHTDRETTVCRTRQNLIENGPAGQKVGS